MILAAGLGVAIWGERLSRANYVGLSLAVVALILLRL
jgi:multidrug transporter EmrE-like cation transporter